MKRIITIVSILAVLSVFTVTSAIAGALFPRSEGNDVIVPDLVIQQIPDFDPDQPVYAACDINGWLVRDGKWASQERLDMTEMKQDSDGNWIAKGLRGAPFHPAQIRGGEPQWAKIEDIYPLDKEFVSYDNETDKRNMENPSLRVD